jgi:hypothetical protein
MIAFEDELRSAWIPQAGFKVIEENMVLEKQTPNHLRDDRGRDLVHDINTAVGAASGHHNNPSQSV